MRSTKDLSNTRIELIRLWSQRLYRDYDHICFTFRLELQRPVIRVESLEGRWGLWDPEIRTISLSETLIRNFAWDTVIEILKHEMAHQIVFDLFGSDQAHGPLFHRAAEMLGMSAWACRAETDLAAYAPQSVEGASSTEEERLLRRVEKLLALAASSNEHEAFAAMTKVRELQSKYQIDYLRAKLPPNHLCFTIALKRKRVERYQSVIASLLTDHFFVEVIHSHLFDAADCCDYKTLELLGLPQNVKMAEYVFHFLSNQLPLLWSQFRDKGRPGRVSKTSYFLGVLKGFGEKLEQQTQQALSTISDERSVSLLALGDQQLEAFVKYRFPRLQNISRGKRYHDPSAYEAGRRAGTTLKLHRGLSESRHSGRLLTS